MIERILRGVAGSFILISLLLAYFLSWQWLWFTAFIAVNLLQSAFTNWCPMMWILEKCGCQKSCGGKQVKSVVSR
ncbi:MAG: DUF2892 domain-containing protein [Candidatus Omnitrophota bacterium]